MYNIYFNITYIQCLPIWYNNCILHTHDAYQFNTIVVLYTFRTQHLINKKNISDLASKRKTNIDKIDCLRWKLNLTVINEKLNNKIDNLPS